MPRAQQAISDELRSRARAENEKGLFITLRVMNS